ncbi:MAG: PPC domain-containing protein, partial [Limnospira sp. PMC 1279.21]
MPYHSDDVYVIPAPEYPWPYGWDSDTIHHVPTPDSVDALVSYGDPVITTPESLSEDRFAPNHSFEAAHDFGTVTSQLVQNELVIVSGNDDWFSFTTNGTAGSGAEVRIDFLHSLGDVDMRLYDANNNWLGSSTSVSDNESISLAGLGAGTYYVRVWGWSGASNPNYSLTIDPRV